MLDLEPIKAREAAATAKPWSEYHGIVWPPMPKDADDQICECNDWNGEADEAFIIHARTDVPALIAEVEMLREELASVAWAKRL